jgi:hypothetical protein
MAMPLTILLGDYSYRDKLYIGTVHWIIDFFPPPSREWIESEIQFNVKDLRHVILCDEFSVSGSAKNHIEIVCEGETDRSKVRR